MEVEGCELWLLVFPESQTFHSLYDLLENGLVARHKGENQGVVSHHGRELGFIQNSHAMRPHFKVCACERPACERKHDGPTLSLQAWVSFAGQRVRENLFFLCQRRVGNVDSVNINLTHRHRKGCVLQSNQQIHIAAGLVIRYTRSVAEIANSPALREFISEAQGVIFVKVVANAADVWAHS